MFKNDTKPSPDEALKHYGVKGMRWGVRKSRVPQHFDDDYGDGPSKLKTGVMVAAGSAAAYLALRQYAGLKIPAAKEVLDGVVVDAVKGVAKTATRIDDIVEGEVIASQITSMRRGSSAVKALPPGVWKTPIAAITSG